MTLRIFGPEEDAVFEQLAKRREKVGPNEDYFVYFISDGQKELQSNSKARDYGIGVSEQSEIITRLIEDGIIEADRIISSDPQDANKYILKYHDSGWLEDNFSITILSDLTFEDNDYDNCFFVHLGFNHIKAIDDNCRAIYPCRFCYDEDQFSFYVEREDNGEVYYVTKLRKDMPPFQVLLYAYNTKHMHATREGMNKSGDRRVHIGKASISSRVFAERSVVRNELSPFVTLDSENIDITKEVNLTFNQLKALENA